MSKNYLFDKVQELKEKFNDLFKQKKKLKALEHYATTGSFKHAKYLPLVRQCMQGGFLEKPEADFLDHMLNKYELNYLEWSHKTKWLKGEIRKLADENTLSHQQMNFPFLDLDKKRDTYNVPVELLIEDKQQNRGKRR